MIVVFQKSHLEKLRLFVLKIYSEKINEIISYYMVDDENHPSHREERFSALQQSSKKRCFWIASPSVCYDYRGTLHF